MHAGDYLGDIKLKRCSYAARGVYIELLCIAFQCDERGVFITEGVVWTKEEILESIGGDMSEKLDAWAQLTKWKRFKVREDGAFYNSRMVRDEAERASNAKRQSDQRDREKEENQRVKADKKSNAKVTVKVTQEVTPEITVQSTEYREESLRVLEEKNLRAEDDEENARARENPTSSPSTSENSQKTDEKPEIGSAPKPKEEIPPDSVPPPFVDFSKTRLPIERLKDLYLKDQIGAEAVCMSYSWGNIEMLDAWLDAFNHWRKQQGETSDNQKNYRNHFLAWIRKQPNQEDPKTLNNQNRKHGKSDNGPPKNTGNAFSRVAEQIEEKIRSGEL